MLWFFNSDIEKVMLFILIVFKFNFEIYITFELVNKIVVLVGFRLGEAGWSRSWRVSRFFGGFGCRCGCVVFVRMEEEVLFFF